MEASSHPATRILVVEDEPVFRGLLCSVLEGSDHHVETASDGLKALEILGTDPQRFDLVITDIQMPRMTGLELAEKLMKDPHAPPVIAMTGFGDMDLVVRLLRLGVEDFLEKPFGFDDMGHRVKAVLDRHQDRRVRPSAPQVFPQGQTLQLDRNPEEVRRLLEGMRDQLDEKSARTEGLVDLAAPPPYLGLEWKFRKVAHFGGTLAILRTQGTKSGMLIARSLGHDRASLQLSVMVRILHEAMWTQYAKPEEFLRALGRVLLQQKMPHPLMAAAIHCDGGTESLEVAVAGFPAPIPLGGFSRRASMLLPKSPPLGASPNMDVESTSLRFSPGDRILLPCPSLQGLARNLPTGARMELGQAGLEDLANESQSLPLQALVDRVWQGSLEFSHWHSNEDLLLVGLERH